MPQARLKSHFERDPWEDFSLCLKEGLLFGCFFFFFLQSIYFSSRAFKVFEIYISIAKMIIHSFERDYKEV